MADKKKTSDRQPTSREEIEDAVVINTEADQSRSDETIAAEIVDTRLENPDKPETLNETSEVLTETETANATGEAGQSVAETTEASATDDDQNDQGSPVKDATKAEHPAPTSDKNQTVIVRKGGFMPMVLGGFAAAAIGFGLAHSGVLSGIPLPGSRDAQDQLATLTRLIETQDNTISALSERMTELEQAPSPATPEIPDLSPLLDNLSTQIGVLAQRIDDLEARPASGESPDTSVTQAELAAAMDELEQFRQALDVQRAEIAALADAAAREEEAANLTALAAMQRASLSRIQTALDTGTPFNEALADLRDSGVDIPDALAQQSESGVESLAALQNSFPDLAREALRAARQENGRTGVGAFLEAQLGLRSLEPRDGDDPDAVLSRAEAALRSGDLMQALTEIDTLTGTAATVLSGWRSQAGTRIAALDAARTMSQALNTN